MPTPTKLLEKLTPRMREIAELTLAGKSRRQIAEIFGVKPETIKKTLQRARRRVGPKHTAPRMRRTRVRPFSLLSTDNI